MNAISKRLLSWLCVIAMVLSFVPVMDLSGWAVKTQAAETETPAENPGADQIAEGDRIAAAALDLDPATAKTCPIHGDIEGWTLLESDSNSLTKGGHYYLAKNIDSNKINWFSHASTFTGDYICLHLNGTSATVGGRIRASKACTWNIMGEGTITWDGYHTYTAESWRYGVIQISSTAEVNLYGGTWITKQTDQTYPWRNPTGATNMFGTVTLNGGGTFNMYSGAKLQYDASATSGTNVAVSKGTFNMYGGTVENGKGFPYHYDGTPTSSSTVEAPATGKSWTNAGGNVYLRNSNAFFNMYDGTITEGIAGTYGGEWDLDDKEEAEKLYNETFDTEPEASKYQSVNYIMAGSEDGYGGNIYVYNADITVSGGTISNGKAFAKKYIQHKVSKSSTNVVSTSVTYNVSGGQGGNIYVSKTGTLGEGVIISGGQAEGYGGNIHMHNDATLNTEATIYDGVAGCGGGNINVNAGTLYMTGGTLANGKVTGLNPVEAQDGTILLAPTGGHWGGNIRAYGSDPSVNITGGLIYGGVRGTDYVDADGNSKTANRQDNNIAVLGELKTHAPELLIGGDAVIVGDIGISAPSTKNSFVGTKVTLTGKPQILKRLALKDVSDGVEKTVTAYYCGFYVPSAAAAPNVNIDGLDVEATIYVSTGSRYVICAPSDNAATVEACFISTNSKYMVALQEDKTLAVVTKAPRLGVFAPEEFEGKAYCPVCYENGTKEPVTWTVYDGANTNDGTALKTKDGVSHYHMYLDKDWTYETGSFLWTYTKVCFNLNGHDVTAVAGASSAFGASSVSTINLMDTEGGAVVTGYKNKTNAGAALQVAGADAAATINIYGGTYTKLAADTKSSVVKIGGNGGKINMYGGTIDATDLTAPDGAAVHVCGSTDTDTTDTKNRNAVFTMYDGTIKGGTATNGGAVSVGSATGVDCATFTMNGGIIENGHATKNGGNIYVIGVNSHVTQNAGSEVRNGTCGGTGGGNVYVNASAIYDMKGGKIYGGKNVSTSGSEENAGNVLVQGTRKELDKEAKTEEFTEAYFNMSGDAEIYGGIAPNQGGNVRVYIGTFTMTDNAKIYDGDGQDQAGSVDDLWLVDSNLVMSGNAAIIASETSGTSVSVGTYRRSNTATLSGNASITGGARPLSVSKGSHANYKTPIYNTLQIANDWTGIASVDFTTAYEAGAIIDAKDGICGTITDGVFTAGGTYTGNLYSLDAGGAPIFGVNGELVIAGGDNLAAVADENGVKNWFDSNEDALAAYKADPNSSYVLLSGPATIEGNVVLVPNGEVTLSGEGTVSLIDPANQNFESSTGSVKLAAEAVTVGSYDNTVNGKRYITLKDGDVLSAHYIEIKLTSVTLRNNSTEPGLYYKAAYKCDAALKERVFAYGVGLNAFRMPTVEDFLDPGSTTRWTGYDGAAFKALYGEEENYTVATISCALKGVLKAENSAAENTERADIEVHAVPYLVVDYNGTDEGVSTYMLGESQSLSFNEVVGMIGDNFDNYKVEKQQIILNFIKTWGSFLKEEVRNKFTENS